MADQDENQVEQPDVIATEEESRGIYIPFVKMTLGEFIDEMRGAVRDLDREKIVQAQTIDSRNREIATLHQTVATKNVKIAELTKVAEAKTPAEIERLQGVVQVHGAKISQILSELYALMIDPVFDGQLEPEAAFAQLKSVAEMQRQQLSDAQGLAEQVKKLTVDLGVARMLLQKQKAAAIPQGIENLEGGGIRIGVTLDCDEAAPLLSWADSAGEEPAVYVERQLHDALVAVTSS